MHSIAWSPALAGVHTDWLPQWARAQEGSALSARGLRMLSGHLLGTSPALPLPVPSVLRWVAWRADALDALASQLLAAAAAKWVRSAVQRKEVIALRALLGDDIYTCSLQAQEGGEGVSALLPEAPQDWAFGSALAQGRHILAQRLHASSGALALRMQWKYPRSCRELSESMVFMPQGLAAVLDPWLKQRMAGGTP